MSGNVIHLLRHDARLQWRYGIYAAYGVVLAFYVALLVSGRQRLPAWVPGVIIFTDPAALGFYFLGALMMLERAEGVRTALAVSPLRLGGPQPFPLLPRCYRRHPAGWRVG